MDKIYSSDIWSAVRDPARGEFKRQIGQWTAENPNAGFKAFWNECGDGNPRHFDLAKAAFGGMSKNMVQSDDKHYMPLGGIKAKRPV